MAERVTPTEWDSEDAYWRSNFHSRPYASGASQNYDYFQPGYRYGVESADRYQGRRWEEVESNLRRDWERYEHRGQSTWEQMKSAVRDAWERVTGRSTVSSR